MRYRTAVREFEVATRFFVKGNYRKADEIFQKLVTSAPPEVADRARVHLRLCQQRLVRPKPVPKTAEDCYNLGVAELNARNLDLASAHLAKAHKMEPEREDIRYALATAHALRGDLEAALEHLKAAIALRPENRIQARHDVDFEPLASDPRFRSIVYPADSSAGRLAPSWTS